MRCTYGESAAHRRPRPFGGPLRVASGLPAHQSSRVPGPQEPSGTANSQKCATERLRGWEDLQAAGQRAVALAASALLVFSPPAQPPPAHAVLNSPNALIARSADAALRRSIPAFNPSVRQIQRSLEDLSYLLRIPQRKPYGSMAADVDAALAKFAAKEQLLEGVPPTSVQQAEALLDQLYTSLSKLQAAVKSQQSDYISVRVADALRLVAELELLQAPGLAFILPKEYASLPRLVGRAVVELTVERRDGSAAFVDGVNGGLSTSGVIQLTLDGYSAPISAGNFLSNVLAGAYDGRRLEASRTAVVVPSPPTSQRPPIPLEILPLGEFDPLYRIPLDVQTGELPVLPLSIDGAVSFTHVPGTDSFVDGDAFFLFRFDKSAAGLAGLAFDEGQFGVFGYVTMGLDVMKTLQSGDIITRAAVLSGADKLVVPDAGSRLGA